jgi:hypothetical protein
MTALSLDGAVSFFDGLGLDRAHAPVLREIGREYLSILPPYPIDWDVWPTPQEREGINRRWADGNDFIEHALDERLPPRTRDRLRYLADEFARRAEGTAVEMRWWRAFWSFAYGSDDLRPRAPVHLPPERVRFVEGVIRDRLPSDSFDSLEEAAKAQASEWDAELLGQWGDDGTDPYVSLSVELQDVRTRETWRALRSTLSTEELNEVVRWANDELNRSKMSRPGAFGPPDW